MFDALKKLFELLNARERLGFWVLLGIMLFEALLEIVSLSIIPAYMSIIVYPDRLDAYLPEGFGDMTSIDALLWVSGFVLFFFTLKLLVNTGGTYIKVRYAQNRALRLSHRLYRAYMQAPYTYHLQRNSANLLRNLSSDSTQLANLVLIPFMEMMTQGMIILAVVLALIFYIPVIPLLILLGALLIAAWVVMGEQKKIRLAGQRAQRLHGRVVQDINEGLGCAKEIKLLGRASHFLQRFQQHFSLLMQHQRRIRVLQKFIPNWVELATIFGMASIVLYLYQHGKPSDQVLQVLTVSAVGLARLKGSLSSFMNNYSQAQQYRSSLEVIYADLNELDNQIQASGEERRVGFQHTLQLKQVYYRYPETQEDTLKSIDLTIRKGEAVGFIGKTGAGKTTLIDLIIGLLEPTSGQVLLDGRPLHESIEGWQRAIGYVPQIISLIDATLRENIALGIAREQIDEQALCRSVEQAQLNELVERLPQGLDTVIGERGIRLSGGQRQRVAIARALYHAPDILVLDEGTSALDHETEAEVIKAVESLKGKMTILMIAHRLSTLTKCDRIVELENGILSKDTDVINN